MRRTTVGAIVLGCAIFNVACGNDGETTPTPMASLVIVQTPAPASGSTIATSTTQFGGAFIDRGSGKLSVPLTIQMGSDETVARVFVYAKDAGGVTCAQNLPDAPDLAPLKRGDSRTLTITGFQVYRLPCEVTSFRVVLNRRASTMLNTELTAAEIIAEASVTARYSIQ